MPEAIEFEKDKAPKKTRRFTQRDKDQLALWLRSEWEARAKRRRDSGREKLWKEVDRQVRMEPDLRLKRDPNSDLPLLGKEWLPELELPGQRQALEVLCADSRRLLFPKGKDWFNAHVKMTDQGIEKLGRRSLVAGDEMEVPSNPDQEDMDKLVEGYLRWLHGRYNLRQQFDMMNAEAFKYGGFVGRLRMVRKTVYMDDSTSVKRETDMYPVFFAKSIKTTYLDDSSHRMFDEGIYQGPSIIEEYWIRDQDLMLASMRGSTDPDSANGGWLPDQVKKIEPDDNGNVHVLEMEGDIVIPRKTGRSMFIPNAIATVANSGTEPRTIRLRFNSMPFCSYITSPYHVEDVHDPYGTGPLGMGAMVQMMATESGSRWWQAAALNTDPPLKYDPNDPFMAAMGGPEVFPGAKWKTTGMIEPVQIGDLTALINAYITFTNQYSDLTGVLPARLGAQTVSHTTAFAKDAELQRGASRTVDYTDSVQDDPMVQLLAKEYELGRKFRGTRSFYIKEFGGFVDVQSDQLPDTVEFEVLGSAGPLDEQQKDARKQAAFLTVVQLEQLKAALPPAAEMVRNMQQEILQDAGVVDTSKFLAQPSTPVPGGVGGPGQLPGVATADPGSIQDLLAG